MAETTYNLSKGTTSDRDGSILRTNINSYRTSAVDIKVSDKEQGYTGSITNLSNMFYNYSVLRNVDLSDLNTYNVSRMTHMFYNCRNIVDGINNFDTSAVEDIGGCFNLCTNLLSIPEIDTSNVANMCNAFRSCVNLVNLPALNTSNATDLSNMFCECTNLVNVSENLSNYNFYNVEKAEWMFYNCRKIASLPDISFNSSKNTNISYMFGNCVDLTSPGGLNVKGVKNLTALFVNCGVLQVEELDISDAESLVSTFYSTSRVNIHNLNFTNVKYMNNAFSYCNVGSSFNDLNFPNVKDMYAAFQRCSLINNMYNVNFPNLINMQYAFSSCYSLRYIDGFSAPNLVNAENVFISCSNLESVSNIYVPKCTTTRVLQTNRDYPCKIVSMNNITSKAMFSVENCRTVKSATNLNILGTSLGSTFYNCTELTDVSFIDTSNVTYFSSLFANCNKLVNVSGLNTDNATSMDYIFQNCKQLNNVYNIINNLNTSKVTQAAGLFCGLNMLNNIPKLDLSKITSIQNLFNGCSDITSIDLTEDLNINPSNILYANHTFVGCSNLTSLSNFSVDKLSNDLSYLFSGCKNLPDSDFPSFENYNKIGVVGHGLFQQCSKLTNISNLHINLSNFSHMSSMFYACNGLEEVKDIHINNPTSIRLESMQGMFQSCNNLVNVSNFKILSPNVNIYYGVCNMTFYGCSNLKQIDNSRLPYVYSPFGSCVNLETINNTYISIHNDTYYDGGGILSGFQNLKSVTNSTFDRVGNVYGTSGIFANDYQLSNVANSKIDGYNGPTGNVFYLCYALNNVDGLIIDRSNNISKLFYQCSSLTDVTNLNITNLKENTMAFSVFYGCSRLENIPEWDLSRVNSVGDMFAGCNNLSDASIQNIINMMLNMTLLPVKNLNTSNSSSPFRYTNITSDKYANRLEDLTNAGWTY